MSEKIKISIILVCWNVEDTIEKTLLNLFNQTHKNIDLVIIDGASKDSTLQILGRYKDKIGTLVSEPDKGTYDAMNKGIENARGDILFFLNSGDVFYDDKVLEDVAKTFANDASIEILAGDVQVTKDGKNLFVKDHANLSDHYFMLESICHQGLFFKAELIKKYRFDTSLRITADFKMFLEMYKRDKCKVVYKKRFIAYYPLGGQSSPQDPEKYERINKEFRQVRIQIFGRLKFIQFEYKKRGPKGVIKELIGHQTYQNLATLIIYLYQSFVKSNVALYSIFLSIIHSNQAVEDNSHLVIAEFDKFGGTRTFLIQLLTFLSNDNQKVVLLLQQGLVDSDLETFLKERNIKTEIFSYNINKFKILKRLSLLRESLIELSEISRISLKYKTRYLTISVGTQGKYAVMLKSPLRILYYLHTYPSDQINPFIQWSINSSLNQYKHLVTVSKTSLGKCISGFNIKSTHFAKYIYNNVGSIEEEILERKDPTPKILTIGHVNDYKDPYLWIEIAREVHKSIRKINFLWIGDGSLMDECKAETQSEEYIKFLGSMDHSKIPEIIAECDIYLQTSKMESFGLSVVEAMKQGKPTIVSSVGGLTEVVNNETGILIQSREPKDYAREIIKLMQDSELSNKMGRNGRLRFEKEFSTEVWAKNIKSLYNKLN